MFTLVFWRDAAERAAKTAGQTFGAYCVTAGVSGVVELDWITAASVTGLGALLSLASSLASTKVGRGDSASLDPHEDL